MIRQCAVIKQRAPKLSCIFYMNAAIDFEWYQLHQTMLLHENPAALPDLIALADTSEELMQKNVAIAVQKVTWKP